MCALYENYFANYCNLSPNTRIIAATRRCGAERRGALSKLFPCVTERGRSKMYRGPQIMIDILYVVAPLNHPRQIYTWIITYIAYEFSERNIKNKARLANLIGWRYYGRCYGYLFDRCVDIFPWKVQRTGVETCQAISAQDAVSLARGFTYFLLPPLRPEKRRKTKGHSRDCCRDIRGSFRGQLSANDIYALISNNDG